MRTTICVRGLLRASQPVRSMNRGFFDLKKMTQLTIMTWVKRKWLRWSLSSESQMPSNLKSLNSSWLQRRSRRGSRRSVRLKKLTKCRKTQMITLNCVSSKTSLNSIKPNNSLPATAISQAKISMVGKDHFLQTFTTPSSTSILHTIYYKNGEQISYRAIKQSFLKI